MRPVSCPGCTYSGQPHLETCKGSKYVLDDIPLCSRCAETWFCERNHLPEIACVVCAMRPKIDDILAVVWSQHLEADYVCHLKHCPFCRRIKTIDSLTVMYALEQCGFPAPEFDVAFKDSPSIYQKLTDFLNEWFSQK